MKFNFILLAICLPFIFPGKGNAYTNFYSYGYTSCATCHYNPFGGGPLNDYGRALYATAIAGKTIYPSATETQVTKWSGFMGPIHIPEWFRPSLDYRGLKWSRNHDSSSEEDVYIQMNLEYNVVFKYGPNDRFHYSFSYAQYPEPENSATAARDNSIIRENYVSWKILDNLRLLLGTFDIVYGLRIPDHIAFSKTTTGLMMNDQTNGIAAYFSRWGIDGGIHIFMGNPNEDDNVKQSGISTKIELNATDNIRLGGSALRSSSEVLEKYLMAFHGKMRFGKGSSIIAEIGQSTYTPTASGVNEEKNTYGFTQSMMYLFRGMNFLTTFEYNTSEISNVETTTIKYGPGIMWFPVQRIELRSEFFNSRSINSQQVNEDSWNWYTNFHFSF